MRTHVFVLVLTVCIIPFVVADSTDSLYDGWIYGNESFTAGGLTIQLTEDRDNKAIAFKYDDGTVLVTNNTCEVTPTYIFCVDDTREGNFDYWWRYYRLEYKVRVEEKVAKLELSRSVTPTSVLVGQYIDITMTIENTGSVLASDVHFEDVFEHFEIVLTENCLRGENAVIWDGSLQPEESISCDYQLRASEEVTSSPQATVTYYNGKSTATETASEQISVHSAQLLVSASQLSMEIGDTQDVVIVLNNTAPDDIFVKRLTVTIPYGLRLGRHKNWNKIHDYKLQYAGSVIANSARELNFTLTAERAREYFIKLQTDYEVQGIPAVVDSNISIDVSVQELDVDYELPDAVKDEEAHLKVLVRNPSTMQTFTSVDVKLSIQCLNITVAKLFNEIAPTESLTVIDEKMVFPSAGQCGIDVELLYETEYDQQMRLSDNASFTILETAPAPDIPVEEPQIVQAAPVEEAATPTFAERLESSSNLIRYGVIGAAALLLLGVGIKFMRRRKPQGISKKDLKEVEEVIKAKEATDEEEAPGPEEEEPEQEEYELGEPKRDDITPATSKKAGAPAKVSRKRPKSAPKQKPAKQVKEVSQKEPRPRKRKESADESFRF